MGGPTGRQDQPERSWRVSFADEKATAELLAELRKGQRSGSRSSSSGVLSYTVDRYGGFKVEIRSREHPPPHFHVSCAGGAASYNIADCSQIDGGLRREYRAIRSWHERNRQKLIDVWNGSRPADCPVGPYRD